MVQPLGRALAVAILTLLCAVQTASAAQVNTYAAKAVADPKAAGTPASPSPASVHVELAVGEQGGQQPAPVKRYTLDFHGIRADVGDRFATCTADAINSTGNSDAGCPSGSLAGTGTVGLYVYTDNAPSGSGGFPCNKDVRLYNAGLHQAALFIFGDPSQCGGVGALPALPVAFVAGSGGGTALQFDVPANVLHPIQGLSTALRSLTLDVAKRTTTVGGAVRGYLESVGCQGDARPFTATFLGEAGTTATATASDPCLTGDPPGQAPPIPDPVITHETIVLPPPTPLVVTQTISTSAPKPAPKAKVKAKPKKKHAKRKKKHRRKRRARRRA